MKQTIDEQIAYHEAEVEKLLKEKRKTEDDWFQYTLDDSRYVTYANESSKIRWFFNRGIHAHLNLLAHQQEPESISGGNK